MLGLIHLYSTNDERVPDPDDLGIHAGRGRHGGRGAGEPRAGAQELAENLNQIRDENVQLRERLGVQSEIVGSQRRDGQGGAGNRPRRAQPGHRADSRRKRRGQGTGRAGRPLFQSAPQGPVRVPQLRGAVATACWTANCSATSGARSPAPPQRKIGKFEAADKGTLMLDEIGEMSPAIQAKFLRVLEGHPFERVGGSEPIKVDVRVIAATNRDLETRRGRRAFPPRPVLPPARAGNRRAGAAQAARRHSRAGRIISCSGSTPKPAARSAASRRRRWSMMRKYRWPGNVRELKNVVERAVVLARGEFIEHDDLTLSQLSTAGDTGDIQAAAGAVRSRLARRHRTPAHPGHAHGHELEQKPDRRHAGHRTLDARPQNPPLRTGRRAPQGDAVERRRRVKPDPVFRDRSVPRSCTSSLARSTHERPSKGSTTWQTRGTKWP